MPFDLVDHILSEETLNQGLNSSVLLLHAHLDGLLVQLGIGRRASIIGHPFAIDIVRAIAVLIIVVQEQAGLDARVQGFHSSGHRFLGRVGAPVHLIGIDNRNRVGHLFSASRNLARHLVARVVVTVRATSFVTAVGRIAALLGLLDALGWILEDEGGEHVAHVDGFALAASFAVAQDDLVFGDDQVGLWVFARTAEDKLVDEGVEQLAQSASIVMAIDNVAVGWLVPHGLGAQFASKELGGVYNSECTSAISLLWLVSTYRLVDDSVSGPRQ